MPRTALALVALALACDRGIDVYLTQQVDAQRLAADVRIQLHRSTEAAQRAIMADTDEAAAEFVSEARKATDTLEIDRRSLEAILAEVGTDREKQLARDFADAFAKLQELDRTLLPLAVENTNVKAERLSFGPSRDAADALRNHLDAAVRAAPRQSALRAQLLAARAQLAVREIQALQAPHIAEADDAVMTQLEQRMADSEAAARASLDELSRVLRSASAGEIAAAREQLERFAQIQQQLVALSRENSEVRSLASALGDKRELTATCDAALTDLQHELASHEFRATR